MKFYKYLYTSDSLEKKKEKIIEKLKRGEYPVGIYLLVLLQEGENQMELYNAAMLRQQVLNDNEQFVVGIATGYDAAVYLVERIAKEVYERTGDVDIRSFIKEQEGWEN